MKIAYINHILKEMDTLRVKPFKNLDKLEELQKEILDVASKYPKPKDINFVQVLKFVSTEIHFIKEKAISKRIKKGGAL